MGSSTRHSSGRKAASRPVGGDRSPGETEPGPDWKSTVFALRDELSVIHASAAVVQRSLTADDGDTHAALTLLEGVCCPLVGIIGRLDGLLPKVGP